MACPNADGASITKPHTRSAIPIPAAVTTPSELTIAAMTRNEIRRSAYSCPGEFYTFTGHNQAVAADVLQTDRSTYAYFTVFLGGTISSLGIGSSISRQRYRSTFDLALLT